MNSQLLGFVVSTFASGPSIQREFINHTALEWRSIFARDFKSVSESIQLAVLLEYSALFFALETHSFSLCFAWALITGASDSFHEGRTGTRYCCLPPRPASPSDSV